MKDAVVLEGQKGLWIEEQLPRKAGLGERFQIVVEAGQIRILPTATVSEQRFPYEITASKASAVLKEARQEALDLYGGFPPPTDQPYFGGMTWGDYQALSDEQRRALWNRLYAEFDVEIEAIEERDVRPDALVVG